MPIPADMPPSAVSDPPPAISVANEYQPRHSNMRRGFELSSMDFDGVKFAAFGLRGGLRSVGVEVGYKFRETPGGFRTGISATSFYNWVKDEGETEAKYVMAKQKKIYQGGRLLYDITLAYNFSSGAYASSTVKREFNAQYNFGIFQDVTPYVSATISTDKIHREMRVGTTSIVDFVKDTHLRLDVAAEFSHGKPKIVIGTSLRFK